MLTNPTIEKIQSLRLHGFTSALREQEKQTNIDELSFMERLGLLVDQ